MKRLQNKIIFALLALMISTTSILADDSPPLKMDVPKLDSRPQQSQESTKPKSQLKGKVEKINKSGTNLNGSASGMGGDAGTGRIDSRRRNGSIGRANLFPMAEAGIGIIGVKFVMVLGRQPVINRVFPQTPAYVMGLKTDDVIVAIDGIPTAGLRKEEVYDMIVGTPGTTVTLTVKRRGDFIPVTMTRMDLNDITDPFIRRDYMHSL